MTHREYVSRLIEVRRSASVRRASACAIVPERVLGIPLNPITPATWSILMGTRSAFAWGTPATESDLRNFVMFHQPEYNSDRPRPGAWVRFVSRWRLERALVPYRMPRTQRAQVRIENVMRAIVACRAIVNETFSDSPMPDDSDAPKQPEIAACLEVQYLHLFAGRYARWPLATPIRHTPIRVLAQLARCIDRATYFDPAEAELDEEYLRVINQPQPASAT